MAAGLSGWRRGSPRCGRIGVLDLDGAVGQQADRGVPALAVAGGVDGDEAAAGLAEAGDQAGELVFVRVVDVVAVLGVGGAVHSAVLLATGVPGTKDGMRALVTAIPRASRLDGGLVADGQLVIPGRDGPVTLEQADHAFDRVPVLIPFRVEGGWPAARLSTAGPVGSLVSGTGMVARIP